MHQLHELIRLLRDLLLGQLAVLQAELHVLPHRHMGEDRIVLEHHADVSLGGIQIVDTAVVEVEIAALDAVEASDHAQQSGFTAAGRPQQCKKLALLDLQTQIRDDDVLSVLFQSMSDRNVVAHCLSSFPCFYPQRCPPERHDYMVRCSVSMADHAPYTHQCQAVPNQWRPIQQLPPLFLRHTDVRQAVLSPDLF